MTFILKETTTVLHFAAHIWFNRWIPQFLSWIYFDYTGSTPKTVTSWSADSHQLCLWGFKDSVREETIFLMPYSVCEFRGVHGDGLWVTYQVIWKLLSQQISHQSTQCSCLCWTACSSLQELPPLNLGKRGAREKETERAYLLEHKEFAIMAVYLISVT